MAKQQSQIVEQLEQEQQETNPGGGGDGGNPTPWLTPELSAKLPEDVRGFAGKYKSVEDALIGGYNAQRHIGVPPERLITLPEKADDAAGMQAVYRRLGAPEKAEEYDVPVPEGYPAEFATAFRGKALELGLSKAQVAGLAAWNNTEAAAMAQRMKEQEDNTIATREGLTTQALQKAWGPKYGEIMELTRRELAQHGLSKELVDALAATATLHSEDGGTKLWQLLGQLGSRRGESPLHIDTEGNLPRGMTPDQAKARLATLEADKAWSDRLLKGGTDSAENKERLALLRLASSAR